MEKTVESSYEGVKKIVPSDLEKALSKLRKEIRESNPSDTVTFSHAATGNVILVCSGDKSQKNFQDYIYAFTSAQPSRFFLISVVEKLEPSFSVSAICHKLGSKVHVCSEIITIEVPNTYLARIPSILRAQLLSGCTTEVVLLDETAVKVVFPVISQVADKIYFDSAYISDGIQSASDLSLICKKVVDLNWLRLSVWRDAVRIGIEKGDFLSELDKLTSIEIVGEPAKASQKLMVGWFLSRVKKFKNPKEIKIIGKTDTSDTAGMVGFILTFKDITESHLNIELQKEKQILKISTDKKEPLNTEYPLQKATQGAELLQRFFLVGESKKNFKESLFFAKEVDI